MTSRPAADLTFGCHASLTAQVATVVMMLYVLHCAPVSRSKVKVTSSHRLYVASLPLFNSGNKMLYLCR